MWESSTSGSGPQLHSAVVLFFSWLACISPLVLLPYLLTIIVLYCWYVAVVSFSVFACVGFRELSGLPKLKTLSELLQFKKLSVKWSFP